MFNKSRSQRLEARAARIEQRVRIEEAKSGKTLRRSGKHVRKADMLEDWAAQLREEAEIARSRRPGA